MDRARPPARPRPLLRALACVLALAVPLQACAGTAVTQRAAPSEGGAPGVSCSDAELREYRSLESLSEQQPLTESQEERMEELYRSCFEGDRTAAAEADGGMSVGRALLGVVAASVITVLVFALSADADEADLRLSPVR